MITNRLALRRNKKTIDLIHDKIAEIFDGLSTFKRREIASKAGHDGIECIMISLEVGHHINETLKKIYSTISILKDTSCISHNLIIRPRTVIFNLFVSICEISVRPISWTCCGWVLVKVKTCNIVHSDIVRVVSV